MKWEKKYIILNHQAIAALLASLFIVCLFSIKDLHNEKIKYSDIVEQTINHTFKHAMEAGIADDLEAFSLQLTAALKDKGTYSPYKLEKIPHRFPNNKQTIKEDGFIEHRLTSYCHEWRDSSSALYRFTASPFKQIAKETAGLFFWVLLALLVQIIAIIRMLMAMKDSDRALKKNEDFINMVTHNMNGPISVAMAATESLQIYPFKEKEPATLRYLSIIKEQLQKLGDEVKAVLLSAKVENMKTVLKTRDVNLFQTVKSITEHLEIAYPRAKFNIEIHQDAVIDADPVLFDEILCNLLQNAVKHSGENPAISITYDENSSIKSLAISDNGKGIPEKDLKRIFDKYYMVENHAQNHGYGLGLHFVKYAIDLLGWNITASSNQGEGSVFTIIF